MSNQSRLRRLEVAVPKADEFLLDRNGFILSPGEWQGRHIDDYLDALLDAMSEEEREQAAVECGFYERSPQLRKQSP
jgi:hypothetical protein